jgi:hypothetical protein
MTCVGPPYTAPRFTAALRACSSVAPNWLHASEVREFVAIQAVGLQSVEHKVIIGRMHAFSFVPSPPSYSGCPK